MPSRNSRLKDSEYERFRELILTRSGLHFPEKRRRDLESGVWRGLSLSGCKDLDAYYSCLAQNHTGGEAWEQLICQLTVGETYFFRDGGQFEALRQHVLPEIIARRRPQKQLRIWSAGCATGEEPYSIAMLLRELLVDFASWNITILGSDINREALARARAGLYGEWSFREKGWERMVSRHFTRRDKKWELAHDVRDTVSLVYLNLVEDPFPSLVNNTVAFDLILCRNVTIYFTADVTQRVVNQLHEALVEGGWLAVGHSEPSLIIYSQFEPRNFPGTVFYQKTGSPARFDLSWFRPLEKPVAADLAMPALPPLFEVGVKEAPVLPPKPQAALEEREPPVSPEELCRQAEDLLVGGDVEGAVERLESALTQDGECARACFLLGRIWADQGHWEEARHWCELAVEKDVLLKEGHFLLGLIHYQEGRLDESLAAIKRVVYLDRDAVLGHFWMANLYREIGDDPRAHKSLENTERLLRDWSPEAMIPWSEGLTAGRLHHIVRLWQEKPWR